jgi:YbbR domain-containing protein
MTGSLKDLILKDVWLKLFSLALATLIWFTVNIAIQNQVSPVSALPLVKTDRRTFSNLPVVIVSSAQDTRSTSVNPKEVEVTVEGDAKVLKSLYNRDIRVWVDLTGIEAAHDMRKRVEVSTPAGVTHVTVEPPEIQVIFPPKS